MSNALAIASVTAVLKDLLDNALIDHSVGAAVGGPVLVTALAPDLIDLEDNNDDRQLNIFLYHVMPSAAWRNVEQPSRNARGERLTNPPLALDLHYMLTAYGTQDFEAEILLGYAMQLMHEVPVLTREAIRRTLVPPGAPVSGVGLLPPALDALAASDLADQVEQIKITPLPLNTEELSKLWSAFQANYRPSVAYQVSTVLIESTRPSRTPLPVLTRGIDDRGVAVQASLAPPLPVVEVIAPPAGQTSAVLGDELVITGYQLNRSATATVLVRNTRLAAPLALAPLAGTTATGMRVRLEINPATDAANFVAGVYTLAVVFDPGTPQEHTTNESPFALAPSIADPPPASPPGTPIRATATRAADGVVTIEVECRPDVRPTQRASLVVGDREAQAEPHATQTNTLVFRFPTLVAGSYFVRLRVDGVESRLIDRSVVPPVFRDSQRVTIP